MDDGWLLANFCQWLDLIIMINHEFARLGSDVIWVRSINVEMVHHLKLNFRLVILVVLDDWGVSHVHLVRDDHGLPMRASLD